MGWPPPSAPRRRGRGSRRVGAWAQSGTTSYAGSVTWQPPSAIALRRSAPDCASDGGEVSVRIADLLWEGRPHARTATTAGRLRLSRGSLSLQLAPCDTTLRRLQARSDGSRRAAHAV